LYDRITPNLDQIPPYFQFTGLRVGIPETTPIFYDRKLITEYPYPAKPGEVFIFNFDNWEYDGYSFGDEEGRAAIQVERDDPIDVVILRIWHELLHAVGQPADDMTKMRDEWQTWVDRVIWCIWTRLGYSVDVPYWQRKFYRYLTGRAVEEDRGKEEI